MSKAVAEDVGNAGIDAESEPTDLRVLQRVVFPVPGNLDVVPLYVETNMDRGFGRDTEQSGSEREQTNAAQANTVPGETESAVAFATTEVRGAGDLAARRRGIISAGRRVSFGAYFNAFPASYWSRWTTVHEVVLRVRVNGACSVIVYQSTAKGKSHPVESIVVPGDSVEEVRVTLPLKQFIDGGWYWFDIAAAEQDVTLLEADWAARTDRLSSGTFSIAMTTHNRPTFCIDGLKVLAESPDVLEILDKIYVMDQGTDHPEDHPEFADATKGLGDKLVVIRQGNLGGSGGFSRGMDETAQAGVSDYVLVLDDDVITEPESMLRAVTFADLTRRPSIVGGHMFSLYDRSVLHAFGETVAKYNWWWGPAPNTEHEHDFSRYNLRNTSWLHRRIDVDYNGWWMCLIPVSAVKELGLALPVFIKWDDAEYGLRAREADIPTVSMPGVAVWHVPWQDKNDALDWQTYYHLRNRIVAALMHSPYPRGGSLISENIQYQIRHLLSMQYSTAKLRIMAINDVLSGPDHLHRDLATKMADLRAVRTEYTDSATKPDLDEFPSVKRLRPPRRGKEPTSPRNPVGLVIGAAMGVLRQIRPVSELAKRNPQATVASQDAEWWVLSNLDGAIVSSADGTSAAWYQRDPAMFRDLSRESAAAFGKLWRAWPQLQKEYQDATDEFTSPDRWRKTFEASTD